MRTRSTGWQGSVIRKFMVIGSSLLVGLLIIGYAATDDLTVSAGQSVGILSSDQIQGDITVGQTFVAPYPRLNRIAVKMRAIGRNNGYPVTFHLRQGREAETDIFTTSFSTQDVKDEEWRDFSFPKIEDSAGVTYYFYFESPQSSPDGAITVMGQEGDPYPEGEAYQGDDRVPGDMAFKTYYQASLRERLGFLLMRFTEHKPSLWGDCYFYVGLVVVYSVAVISLFKLVVQSDDET